MSDFLDIRTLLIMVIVTYSCCAAALAFLRSKIPSIHGLGAFLAGILVTIPCLAIYTLPSEPHSFLSSILANFLGVLGFLLFLEGILRFYHRPVPFPLVLASLALLPLYVYWTKVAPNTELRVLAVILPCGYCCLAIAWIAARHSHPDERQTAFLMVLGFGVFGLSFFVRALVMGWNPWASIMAAGAPSTAMTFLLSTTAMILGTLSLTLVASQRLVRELEVAREDAEAGSRAKSEFLAVMSHEIRTPMNGVLGGAGLILASPTNPKIHRYAETIESSGRAMLRIVDEILDFAKIEAGGLDLEPFPFDLVTEVESTVGAFREVAKLKGLQLTVDIAPTLARESSPNLIGDPGRLRQVLSNLINNALKFTESGGVEVRLSIVGEYIEQPHESLEVLFEVCDTGPGISRTRRQEIFEPFNQGKLSTHRRFGGTGLGLSICRELVERMGGRIGIRGRRDPDVEGSVFWFTVGLPVASPEESLPPTTDPSTFFSQLDLVARRILIAEDNPINQFVLTEMLEELGHEVEVAGDGRQTIQRLREGDFDLILMDCRMPEMDGFETTRHIRGSEELQQPPIVAVTATTSPDELDMCLQAGMDATLTKPIRVKDLHKALETWLPAAS